MKNELQTEGKTLKKWYTTSEFVDVDTGELINKKEFEKDYHKIQTTRKIEIKEDYGIIKYLHECRSTRQTRLKL
jgi:hypothetical protein